MEDSAGNTGVVGRGEIVSSTREKQGRGGRDDRTYRETLFTKVGFYCLKKTLGPLVRGLWIKKVEGLEHLPEAGPVIVASNHASYLDFLCFVAVSPRNIHYLAAEKFFRSPLWRPIMELSGQIKVDRFRGNKRHTMCQVHSALDQGRVIGIFPEGTRSPDGTIQSAYSGVARFALASKAPVVPVGVIGAYDVWPREQALPRLAREIHIRIGEPLSFDAYHDMAYEEDHFLEVTETIMGKIRELTGQHPEPVKTQTPGKADQ